MAKKRRLKTKQKAPTRDGIFINIARRADLKEVIERLKVETGITSTAELVAQTLRLQLREIIRKNSRLARGL